jgi:hypothetical protein
MIFFLFLFSAVHAEQIVKIPGAFNPTQIHVTKDRMYIVDTMKELNRCWNFPLTYLRLKPLPFQKTSCMCRPTIKRIRKRNFMFLRQRENSWGEYFCLS